MLRARLPRRALFGAAVAAAIAVVPREEKPPIYPVPEPQLVLIDTPSELEHQIRLGRERLTARYADSYAYVQGWVDRWIGVEQVVEQRIKSFKAPDEQLTPGILYVGVATLSGSILARSRGLPTRFLLPPTLFLLSFNHFLPKTASNIGSYVSDLEHTYAPRAAQFTDTAVAHTQMTWEMAKDKLGEGRAALERGVESAVGAVQDTTGLKFREALGMTRAFGKVAEERGREALTVAEGQGKAALHVAEEKGKETAKKIEDAVEKKVDEVKRLV